MKQGKLSVAAAGASFDVGRATTFVSLTEFELRVGAGRDGGAGLVSKSSPSKSRL
jgi:hypothetical protein